MPKALKLTAFFAVIAAAAGLALFVTMRDPFRDVLLDPGLQSPEHYEGELRAAVSAWHARFPQDPDAESFCAVWPDLLNAFERFDAEQETIIENARKRHRDVSGFSPRTWGRSYGFEAKWDREWLLDSGVTVDRNAPRRLEDAQNFPLYQAVGDEMIDAFERAGVGEAMRRVADAIPAWCPSTPPAQPLFLASDWLRPDTSEPIRTLSAIAMRAAMAGDSASAVDALCLLGDYTASLERQLGDGTLTRHALVCRDLFQTGVEDLAILAPPTPEDPRRLLERVDRLAERPARMPLDVVVNQVLLWAAQDRLDAGIDAPGEPGLATGPSTVKGIYNDAVLRARETDVYDRYVNNTDDWEARVAFDRVFPPGRQIDWSQVYRGTTDPDETYVVTSMRVDETARQLATPRFAAATYEEYWQFAESGRAERLGSFMHYVMSGVGLVDSGFHFVRLTELRASAVYLAIRAYEADHGEPPAMLGALVPEYFDEVPADPLAPDGRFRYRVNTDGTFTLYSIGADAFDDGGVLPAEYREVAPQLALFARGSAPPCGDYVVGPARFTLIPPIGIDFGDPLPPGVMECE